MTASVETGRRSRSGSPDNRTTPNSPTRYAPRSTRSSAAIKKPTKTFSRFQDLPLEIQDQVWREALGLDTPTTHGVSVRRSANSEAGCYMIADPLWNSNSGKTRPPIYPARDALHRACGRSRAAGKREPQTWEAAMPYQLHSDTWWRPTQQVDLSRDLFVVSNDLNGTIKPADKMAGVRYVAVPWEGFWDLHIVEKLEKMMKLFPDVDTMYVVVTGASTVHPHLQDWSSEALPVLNAYEKGCKATPIDDANREFACHDMVYKEIAIEDLSSMAGLEKPISYINTFNANLDVRCQETKETKETEETEESEETEEEGGDFKRPAVRIMTWEVSRRVRARFT